MLVDKKLTRKMKGEYQKKALAGEYNTKEDA